ncbi:DUF533 domain-containing protein [Roseovarius aestuarii]|uniref:Inner membrane protein YebE n=1 Tax=Roseovarius aestuarii TaxID=475083 RepID=A0A1X7BRD4_9RHOB|nr:DUF533 domain-containing protein [Roseovarius aestuarii]SMC12192.1 hypothetical protein ROA7745_02015 [Roseovarius aestuarii]
MSMMKTLAMVAIGVALAKGASSMMKKGGSARGSSGDGGLFGGAHSPGRQAQAQSGGGLEDMLGSILGGQWGGTSGGVAAGGLGGLLEQLGGGQSGRGGASGGLNDLLGGLAGAASSGGGSGGLGGLLGGLMGAGAAKSGANGGFGDLLNQAITRQDEPEVQPSQDQEAAAALMLRAMIQAMKSDGEIDQAEQARLMDRLGDVSPEERDFVQSEMQRRIDVNDLARDVPRGLEQQVYAMSIMGIDLDNQNEAKYLHQLATAMGVSPEAANSIHDQLGAQRIYS